MQIDVLGFYPEEFLRKVDQEKYQSKGTCEVILKFSDVQIGIKNITYRIDHEGKTSIKPPYRIYSNKRKGQKPKLVPSITFEAPEIWEQIEKLIKKKLLESIPIEKRKGEQMSFEDFFF